MIMQALLLFYVFCIGYQFHDLINSNGIFYENNFFKAVLYIILVLITSPIIVIEDIYKTIKLNFFLK